MFNIGDFVFFDYGYGKVVSVQDYWQGNKAGPSGMAKLYTVKYYDPTTGLTVKCPDSRCKSTCAICSRNLWAEEMRPMNDHDHAYFKRVGLIKD